MMTMEKKMLFSQATRVLCSPIATSPDFFGLSYGDSDAEMNEDVREVRKSLRALPAATTTVKKKRGR